MFSFWRKLFGDSSGKEPPQPLRKASHPALPAKPQGATPSSSTHGGRRGASGGSAQHQHSSRPPVRQDSRREVAPGVASLRQPPRQDPRRDSRGTAPVAQRPPIHHQPRLPAKELPAGTHLPMKAVIPHQILDILSRLQQHGYDAFIVGGAVRDYLLGLPPKDYDIATSATPEQVKAVFRRRARIIGRRFRIVHVYDELGDICEVSTFRRTPDAEERKDRPDDDGVQVWNDNHYGSIEEDAWRRDFSVNALYYDPFREDGLFDFVDGRRDIEQRVVRALGDPDERIQEDPVRILRALKLVGQFDFTLEPGLDRAVRRYAPAIDTVSKARLFEELRKVIVRNYSLKTFQAFRDHAFLHHFWSELGRQWETPAGRHLQALLAERDRRVAGPGYTASKSLAVATLALPHVMGRLRITSLEGPLWMMDSETAILVRNAIQEFFGTLPVPRFLVSRASEIILLLPRFRDGIRPQRLVRHPEYKYARELFLLVHQVEGWPAELVERWPAPGEGGSTFDNAVDESDGDWEEVGEVARIHMAAEAGSLPDAAAAGTAASDQEGRTGDTPAKKKRRRRRGGRRRKGAPPAAGETGSPAADDNQGAGG